MIEKVDPLPPAGGGEQQRVPSKVAAVSVKALLVEHAATEVDHEHDVVGLVLAPNALAVPVACPCITNSRFSDVYLQINLPHKLTGTARRRING
jgi:hypothetical protein